MKRHDNLDHDDIECKGEDRINTGTIDSKAKDETTNI